ncbi:MAG: MBL fold metallo-hydrolase [Bacteroidales bacterium]|jgi:glyoxylase-like metal-dependent hydrolase (beta-lactamase superfamily II)|nr:MBL fold metallo-hydrolase [Bacteroidales bacterium]
MLKIKTFVFNPFQENTFILYDETKECVIIDAGSNDLHEKNEIYSYIGNHELIPKFLLNTHCHIDHILGNAAILEKYAIPFLAHQEDMPLMERANDMALAFGLNVQEPPKPSRFVADGEEIKFGNAVLEVRHVPGHSPGSVAFVANNERFVIVGDVLFKGSIGRTDLPGGDYNTLIQSIKQKLFSLDNDFEVYPGHGDSTTIHHERFTNPFLINHS